jgi:NAD(P)-dependent dehydrogenase (short-subunit alcohol dehydrogenase family)
MSTVLITGCSSGFGYLTALDLARRGDRVFATMRHPAGAPTLADTAEHENLPLSVHQLNVRDTDSIEHTVTEISQLTDNIDVLINNAGLSVQGPIESLADDELHDQLDTNVGGLVRMVRAVAPLLRAQHAGTIINISSLAGLMGIPFEGASIGLAQDATMADRFGPGFNPQSGACIERCEVCEVAATASRR